MSEVFYVMCPNLGTNELFFVAHWDAAYPAPWSGVLAKAHAFASRQLAELWCARRTERLGYTPLGPYDVVSGAELVARLLAHE